jgi:hypothetical protein
VGGTLCKAAGTTVRVCATADCGEASDGAHHTGDFAIVAIAVAAGAAVFLAMT